jgi:phosphotransferase system  glucose/maltose/N-acetylglucosamine-specific IIC component
MIIINAISPANNLAGSWKRAIGMAIQISIGNLGGAIGSNIYLAKQAPHYWLGYGFSLGVIVVAIISAFILRNVYKRINTARDNMSEEEIRAKYSETELQEMGDDSPFFRYVL